jgi:hypothetical protein
MDRDGGRGVAVRMPRDGLQHAFERLWRLETGK